MPYRYKANRVNGRVTATFAGSAILYHQMVKQIRPEDFDIRYRSANRFRFMGNGMSSPSPFVPFLVVFSRPRFRSVDLEKLWQGLLTDGRLGAGCVGFTSFELDPKSDLSYYVTN